MSERIHMSSQLSFWTVPLSQFKAKERNTTFAVELMAATASEGEGKPIRCKGIHHSSMLYRYVYIYVSSILITLFWSLQHYMQRQLQEDLVSHWWLKRSWWHHQCHVKFGSVLYVPLSATSISLFPTCRFLSLFFTASPKHTTMFFYSFINQSFVC